MHPYAPLRSKNKIKAHLLLCGVLHKKRKFPITHMREEWLYRTVTANPELKKSNSNQKKNNINEPQKTEILQI